MATGAYDKGRTAFLSGAISMLSYTIKVVLLDINGGSPYTVSLANDQYLSDIPSGARIATSAALSGKSVTGGVFDATDATFTAVAGGTVCEALAIYYDTGVAGTSPLIAYIDNYTGLPITTNGGDINVVWDNGANKIFKF